MSGIKDDIMHADATTLSGLIKSKQVSPVEVVNNLLEHISNVNKSVNAYITVLQEESIKIAKHAEKEILDGNWKGPLHGIPVGLKDIIYTKGIKTTMGSQIFEDFIPDYDASVVQKLKSAGAIIVGKLNTHEFALGPTGDRSFFGPVKNPYDFMKISGGSSSGAGAGVASSLCSVAIGTDTGGSIRIPSSICGVVGMKPTFGLVSKFGVYPVSWSLDHVGPITKTVRDNAMVLGILSGYDEVDPYSICKDPEDYTRYLNSSIKDAVIGVPSNFYFEDIDNEVSKSINTAIQVFRSLGVKIKKVDIPHMEEIVLGQRVTMVTEAYAVHEENLRIQADQMDDEVRERIMHGRDLKGYQYARAQNVKKRAIQEFNQVLKEVDIILTPTVPILPFDINQREIKINAVRKEHFILGKLTAPTNFIGFPSLTIPCGLADSGLPIGMQLIGKPFDEANLYRFGSAYEKEISIKSPIM